MTVKGTTQPPSTVAKRKLAFAKTNRKKAIKRHEADLAERDREIAELEALIAELENSDD